MTQYSPVLETSDIGGNTGFRILGAEADDYSGLPVSLAGDVNGDGFADRMIGAPGADPNDERSGIAYVVYGTGTGFANTIDLTSLNAATGARLNGTAEQDFAGWSVSGAGDVNGDGIDDMIVGAIGADENGQDSGAAYVVYGVEGGLGLDFDLSSLDGDNGFIISGAGVSQGVT